MVLVGWMIAITPWTVRNYDHFGRFMYVRSGLGMQLWLGVCPEADHERSQIFNRQFPLIGLESQERIVEMGEQPFLDDCRQRSVQSIKADPWRYVRLSGVRAVDYWLGTVFSHRDAGQGGWPTSRGRAIGTAFLTFEMMFLVIGVSMLPRMSSDYRWLFAILLTFSLTYCFTHVEVRYRTPCEPAVAVFVGTIMSIVWQFISRQRCRDVIQRSTA
jgi:hypothetical protein